MKSLSLLLALESGAALLRRSLGDTEPRAGNCLRLLLNSHKKNPFDTHQLNATNAATL